MSDEPRRPIADIITALEATFPQSAIKQRTIGGGRKADYVDGATVIRRLNEATGHDWSFTVDRYWTENNVTLALVTLTIPGMGSRQHIGVQSVGGSGEDASAKGAITDGLKKSATLFGVGLDLYGPDYEAGELDPAPRNQGQQRQERPPAQSKLMTQLEARRIHEHAKKHNLWQETMDYAHATYAVEDINQLNVDQGRELYRWVSEQGRLRELNPSDEELAATSGARP